MDPLGRGERWPSAALDTSADVDVLYVSQLVDAAVARQLLPADGGLGGRCVRVFEKQRSSCAARASDSSVARDAIRSAGGAVRPVAAGSPLAERLQGRPRETLLSLAVGDCPRVSRRRQTSTCSWTSSSTSGAHCCRPGGRAILHGPVCSDALHRRLHRPRRRHHRPWSAISSPSTTRARSPSRESGGRAHDARVLPDVGCGGVAVRDGLVERPTGPARFGSVVESNGRSIRTRSSLATSSETSQHS